MNLTTRKVMITKREPMRNLRHWSPKLRRKVHQYVYKCVGSFQMPYAVCKDQATFGNWLAETVGEGYWYVFIWRPGYYKKKERLRPYRIAIVEVKRTPQAKYQINFVDMQRIKRFKWWGDNQKRK